MKRILLVIILSLFLFAGRYEHWGGWIDADGDGQNTRQEVLIRDSIIEVTLSEDRTKVLSGLWICPYSGFFSQNPKEFDIDHTIALNEALRSGADKWSKEERIRFANDLENPNHLKVVYYRINRQKSDKDISEWLPELPDSRKRYLNWYIEIKRKYNLVIDENEAKVLNNQQ